MAHPAPCEENSKADIRWPQRSMNSLVAQLEPTPALPPPPFAMQGAVCCELKPLMAPMHIMEATRYTIWLSWILSCPFPSRNGGLPYSFSYKTKRLPPEKKPTCGFGKLPKLNNGQPALTNPSCSPPKLI